MIRKLDLTNDARKFVEQLDAKQFKQVLRKILSLMADATPQDSIKLQGSEYYRADQGEFRIVYRFDVETVYIVVVDKRNDDEVYKHLKRR
jgi:mRNA interferase RelE/StbE